MKEAMEVNFLELYKEAVKTKEGPVTVEEEEEEEEDPPATTQRNKAGQTAEEVGEKED